MSDGNLTPMENMTRISPVAARTYMDHRHAVMDSPDLQALPLKTKLLVGIGVAGWAARLADAAGPFELHAAARAGGVIGGNAAVGARGSATAG